MKLAKLYDLLTLALAPIWGMISLFKDMMVWARTRRLLKGGTEKAWLNCSQIWRERGFISFEQDGLTPILPFEHGLAMAWCKYQPDSKAFILEQIHSADPLLAAYAFKALSSCPLKRSDLSAHLFHSKEVVPILSIDHCPTEISLGQFLSSWFSQKKNKKPEASHVGAAVAYGGSRL